MKALVFAAILFLISLISPAQEQLNLIKPENVKIVSTQSGNELLRGNLTDIKSIIKSFGLPDSTITLDEQGYRINFYYDGNHFDLPAEENANEGFWLLNDQFYVVVNDTVILQVGDKIDKLEQQVDDKRFFKYVPKRKSIAPSCGITLPYGYIDKNGNWIASDTHIVAVYNCETKVITRIYDSVTP